MYKFSESTVAEFYGRKFFSISDGAGNVVAYSEQVFEIHDGVRLLGDGETIIFEKAVILGGEIWGGEIWGGEIRGGVILGGVIRGGVILGGVILGGVIRGGEIWGGEIWGGEIWGGEIWGGVIRGGVIRGGVYEKTLLQIQGSKHFCCATPNADGGIELGIGCHIYAIAAWQEKYQEIGRAEDYTQEQIQEYAEYIALFAARYGEKTNL